jgi:hypothetical protein
MFEKSLMVYQIFSDPPNSLLIRGVRGDLEVLKITISNFSNNL